MLPLLALSVVYIASACLHHPHRILRSHPHLAQRQSRDAPDDVVLPEQFDWRNHNGRSYVTRNLNQHIPKYCGSCWAHAASSSFSDRLKILRNATWPDIDISVQFSLNCLTEAGTCEGGSDLLLYEQISKEGVPDETCEAYVAEDQKCDPVNRCRNCYGPPGRGYCFPTSKYNVYRASDYGFFKNEDIPVDPDANMGLIARFNWTEEATRKMLRNMKSEIYRAGPISCVVDADTMFGYKQGDILTTPGDQVNHVVSVAGWGIEDDTEFWIIRNSWGSYWGDNGWAKLQMGKNVALIESFCSWVMPKWPGEEVTTTDNQGLFVEEETEREVRGETGEEQFVFS